MTETFHGPIVAQDALWLCAVVSQGCTDRAILLLDALFSGGRNSIKRLQESKRRKNFSYAKKGGCSVILLKLYYVQMLLCSRAVISAIVRKSAELWRPYKGTRFRADIIAKSLNITSLFHAAEMFLFLYLTLCC